MLKLSAMLACLTALILAAGEAVLNWGEVGTSLAYIGNSPRYILAVALAAVLLLWGGILTLRGRRRGAAILMGAWGFTLGISYMAIAPVFGFLSGDLENPLVSGIIEEHFLWIGPVVVIALIGWLLALIGIARRLP